MKHEIWVKRVGGQWEARLLRGFNYDEYGLGGETSYVYWETPVFNHRPAVFTHPDRQRAITDAWLFAVEWGINPELRMLPSYVEVGEG